MNSDTKKGNPSDQKKQSAPAQTPPHSGQNSPGSQARPQQPNKK